MKILLAILLCPVLAASQCFAIDGGPWGGGGGHVTVTGTYAGILVPIVDPIIGLADNSLALFTVRVPQTGLASGTSAVFRNGIFYTGTIIGSADPDSARLTGIVAASFQEIHSISSTGGASLGPEYDANGQFVNARIVANTNSSSTAAARIRGKASLTYRNSAVPTDPNGDSGGPILYRIKGFKQSETST
jgi:hypothetical protein